MRVGYVNNWTSAVTRNSHAIFFAETELSTVTGHFLNFFFWNFKVEKQMPDQNGYTVSQSVSLYVSL